MTAVAMRDRRLMRTARPARRGSSQAVVLCLQMLRAGLLLAHLGLVTALGIGLVGWHGLGAANAAVAGGIVIAFLVSGQGVQVLASELSDGAGLALVLLSYLVRAGALGGLLWIALSHRAQVTPVLVRPAFFLGAVLTLGGWLAGVLWRGTHQPVWAYDSAFRAAARPDGAGTRGDVGRNGSEAL